MFNEVTGAAPRFPAAILILIAGLAASAVWSAVGPTLMGVLAALVQTGVTTRLVLSCLVFASAFALFTFRTAKQVWYGYLACVAAVAAVWNLFASLAVQFQAADVVGLVFASYVLVRGLVNIREGERRAEGF
jgi:hypothetical protein